MRIFGAAVAYLNPQNAQWAHADNTAYVISAPIALITALHVAGELFNASGLVQGWYLTIYGCAVLVMANRICIRAALIGASFTIPTYNFLYMGQRFAFDAPIGSEIVAYISMVAAAFLVAPRNRNKAPPKIFDGAADLPFTSDARTKKGGFEEDTESGLHSSGRRFWDVRPTGEWSYDCAVGEEYARIYVERYLHNEPRPPLAWIIADMVANGRFGGTETGFVSGLVRSYGHTVRALRPRSTQNDPNNAGLNEWVFKAER